MIKGKYLQIKEFAATLDRDDFREIELGGTRYRTFTKSVRMSKLGKVRMVTAYEAGDEQPVYLATNLLY